QSLNLFPCTGRCYGWQGSARAECRVLTAECSCKIKSKSGETDLRVEPRRHGHGYVRGNATHGRLGAQRQEKMIKTLEWTADGVRFIDQTRLPIEEVYVTCRTYPEVAAAIRDMVVRGAPAIGVAAAMGIALGVKQSQAKEAPALRREFDQIARTLG